MKKELKIFYIFVKATLQAKLAYRFNFFVQLFYGPAYVGTLYLVTRLAFANTQTLSGFTKHEVLFMFASFQLLYGFGVIAFMNGIRHFVWTSLRQGDFDFVLLKPVNKQLLALFSKPEIQQLPLIIALFYLFFYELFQLQSQITLIGFFSYVLLFVLGLMIVYLTLSTYTTSGFYLTKAAQIIEVIDKAADNSHYPMPIFPHSLQVIAFTFIPIAYFTYIPTLFLLGRGNWQLFAASFGMLIILYIANHLAWSIGIRHYSSASS